VKKMEIAEFICGFKCPCLGEARSSLPEASVVAYVIVAKLVRGVNSHRLPNDAHESVSLGRHVSVADLVTGVKS